MGKRFIGAAIVIVVVGLAFYFGGVVLEVFLMAASLIGLYEMLKQTGFCAHRPARMLAYELTAVLFIVRIFNSLGLASKWGVIFPEYDKMTLLACVLLFFCLALFFVFTFNKNVISVSELMAVFFAFVYVTVLFTMMAEIRAKERGLLLSGFLLMPFVTDVSAYFCGRWFGKKHPLPELSPHKTVAGFIGGFAGGILVGALYAWLFSSYMMDYLGTESLFQTILYGAVCGLFSAFVGEMGDLFSSALKRKAGIKDFGNLIPGHGGIVDRFDSVLLWAPILFFFFC